MGILDEKIFLLLFKQMNDNRIAYVTRFVALYASKVFLVTYVLIMLWLVVNRAFILIPYLIGPALSLLSVIVIRRFINRKRPFEIMGFKPLIEHEKGCSFPSKHGTSAFAIAIAMMWVHPLLGCLGILMAVLTGISRVMVGVHYPSDIVGGLLIAILLSQLTYFLSIMP
ncbi:phosphatase PAP2 family protein [Petrocella sp. FN5]|uniref:phosphatase PAP2 family protein n=1 Tax=Petrocella sp. FN5 TaxID=3032002 RepID=UPI0023DBA290|nr:phosphatase PAP2 family protein [Petrocella sp. FN5]MDF1617769.1 phosphatase PAP2 family protein [Petrocella sp. FN5]